MGEPARMPTDDRNCRVPIGPHVCGWFMLVSRFISAAPEYSAYYGDLKPATCSNIVEIAVVRIRKKPTQISHI